MDTVEGKKYKALVSHFRHQSNRSLSEKTFANERSSRPVPRRRIFILIAIIDKTIREDQSRGQKIGGSIIAIVLRLPMVDTYRKLGLFTRLPERFVGTFSIP